MSTKQSIHFVVLGEPASKANSRRHVNINGISRSIKSSKALNYERLFQMQCPQVEPPITKDVRVTMRIFYASRRPDLDESLILDCMQSRDIKHRKTKEVLGIAHNVYKNDRQVKEKHIFWSLDKENPRTEIIVEEIG